ncbi:MAG: peptidylprolyl isomerase [Planctomycetaceae bacterium]|nr:peptidylprolyl isomerase [Planctomycetaceae bacterium]
MRTFITLFTLSLTTMTMIRYFLLPLCCFLFLYVILPAQAEKLPLAQTKEEAAELGPKNKAYMDTFAEFQEHAKKLRALKIEYQDAKPERQQEIDAQYPGLYKQGLELHKKSIDLALDAQDETPNRNPFVINLLYSTVGWEFSRENYEESVRVFKRMTKSGIDAGADRYYAFAGLAALVSMNFDEAEEWLKKAGESGELEKLFQSWMKTKADRSVAQTMESQMQMMPATKAAWAKEQEIRKAEAEAGVQDPAKKLPRVEFTTTKGKIVLELFENEAPNTVASFIQLVESGFYSDTLFHRVLPTFMAQGGEGNGVNFTINDECGKNFPQSRKHFRGSISMANTGMPNTNSSQFFLTFVPTSHLDGGHTVFGRIVEGLDVLSDIERYDPNDKDAMIPELDKIKEAKVLNKRDHVYEAKRNTRR